MPEPKAQHRKDRKRPPEAGRGGRGAGRGRGRGVKRPRRSKPQLGDGEAVVRRLAEKHWPLNGAAALDEKIVRSVYASYLSRPARNRDASNRLSALELSGYLERYLWPHLTDATSASFEHVMSIVALVNLKSREGVPPWSAFASDPERFAALFARVIDLPSEQPRWSAAGYDARAAWTAFFVNAFAALEDGMVRAQALRLVSLPMWSSLAPAHLQQQLAAQPQLCAAARPGAPRTALNSGDIPCTVCCASAVRTAQRTAGAAGPVPSSHDQPGRRARGVLRG